MNSLAHNATVEIANTPAPNIVNKVMQSIREFASVSELLRLLGAMALLTSMSMFLFQGWSEHNDFERLLMMIAQTVLLGGAGFAMYKGLKENKSARLFFGLSLVSVVTNFTTVGALSFSLFTWDTQTINYPEYARWTLDSMSYLAMGAASILLVSVPLSLFSFSVLSRDANKALTLWFLGLNTLLLLPIREPTVVITIVAAVLYLAYRQLLSPHSHKPLAQWKTMEGKFSRLILFIPLAVMIARSLMWYQSDAYFQLILAVLIYLGLRQTATVLTSKKSTNVLIVLAWFCAIYASISLLLMITQPWFFPSDSWILPVFASTVALASIDLYRIAQSAAMKKVILYVNTLLALGCLMLNHLIMDSSISLLAIIAASIGVILSSWKLGNRFTLMLGTLSALIVPLSSIDHLFQMAMGTGWLGLAIAGGSVIVLASVLDRYGAVLRLRFDTTKTASPGQAA